MTQQQLYQDISYVAQSAAAMYGENEVSRIGGNRSRSPNRGYGGGVPLDDEVPEFNRALARELYVESTVNVVNPNSRSPAKIKPGQMNLFNPKGQKNL